MANPKKVMSYASSETHIAKMQALVAATGKSQSETIRSLIDKEFTEMSATLVQKSDELAFTAIAKFVEQPAENWSAIKAEAGELLSARAQALFPQLTKPAAVAKICEPGHMDDTTKALYKFVNITDGDAFSRLKTSILSQVR